MHSHESLPSLYFRAGSVQARQSPLHLEKEIRSGTFACNRDRSFQDPKEDQLKKDCMTIGIIIDPIMLKKHYTNYAL